MDAERRVVLVDVGMALSWVGLGLLFAERTAIELWWLGVLVALGIVGTTWAGDHGVVSEWTTVVAVIVFGVGLFAAALVWDAELVSEALIPVTLAGMGVGLLVYRIYFGIVRPVPEERLRGASGRTR